ncbi:MAG: gas vesicle protein [Pseudomonadota bacterium]
MTYNPNVDYVDLQTDEDGDVLGLLDRVLDRGVVVYGDLNLCVANVDLVYVGVKALLASSETAEQYREHSLQTSRAQNSISVTNAL